MKRGLEWYKREPVRFLDGVQGMGPELIGAYAVLLDLFYARGGESPRDDRHLAGLLGCSIRKAKALTDALIERGKIHEEGDYLTNSRAKSQSKLARDERETFVKHGRDGAEKRWGNKKSKDLSIAPPMAPTDSREEKRREREERVIPPPPIDGPTREQPKPSSLADRVFAVVAPYLPDIIPSGWLEPSVTAAVTRWSDLALTEPEILAVVKSGTENANRRGDPPASPAYFDRQMRRYAGEKNKPALTPINGGPDGRSELTRTEAAAERRLEAAFAAAQRLERTGR